MTKQQFKTLFKRLVIDLWLWNRDITYEFDNLQDIDWECQADYLYTNAMIWFDKSILQLNHKDIKWIIIHELLHCYLWYRRDAFDKYIKLNNDPEWIVKQYINDLEEISVTYLSRALARII